MLFALLYCFRSGSFFVFSKAVAMLKAITALLNPTATNFLLACDANGCVQVICWTQANAYFYEMPRQMTFSVCPFAIAIWPPQPCGARSFIRSCFTHFAFSGELFRKLLFPVDS
jgi:hypothetical protein